MKYHVLYVEDSVSRKKSFKTKKKMTKFLNEFLDKYGDFDDTGNGYWIEHIFYGKRVEIVYQYDYETKND